MWLCIIIIASTCSIILYLEISGGSIIRNGWLPSQNNRSADVVQAGDSEAVVAVQPEGQTRQSWDCGLTPVPTNV